jgi:predicted dehydrogenase
MREYKWGILGAGNIASQFASDLKILPNAKLQAVASRSTERASEFAGRYNIPVHYGTWGEMSENPDIDIVYIASHHPYHFENTLACLNSGKAVLCEKPFTMNRKELDLLVNTAREKRIFLMEAIWTRFLPSTKKILEIIESAELGKLQDIHANIGFMLEFNPDHRLYDPAKGGGALLDMGIYPVFISLLLAGIPTNIQASARFAETGVDQSCNVLFEQDQNIVSSLSCTSMAETPVEANLLFEKGWIGMESKWFAPGPITIHRPGQNPECIRFPEPGKGYHYEAAEVMRCLDEGLTESPLLPLDFSLDLMGTLDRIRKICGIRYTQDQ